MSFQIEAGICSGRSFLSTGFMGKFKTWVVKTPASGGPGWYIIDDQSALGTDPYIIISDVASPVANGYNNGQGGQAQKVIKCGYETSRSGRVYFTPYAAYDSGTLRGRWDTDKDQLDELVVNDATDFAYDFRGGSESLFVFARVGTATDGFGLTDIEYVANLSLPSADDTETLSSGMTGGSTQEQITVSDTSNFSEQQRLIICDYVGHNWVRQVFVVSIDSGTTMTIRGYNSYPLETYANFEFSPISGNEKFSVTLNDEPIEFIQSIDDMGFWHVAFTVEPQSQGILKISGFEKGLPPELPTIPVWVKQNADWWATQQISDSEFLEGIDFLFEKQILSVPTREAVTESQWKIPQWVQTPASWWYEEKITDEEFLKIIENLVKREIIVI